MHPSIKARFADVRLADVLGRYSLEPNPKLLSEWHAFTFEVSRKGVPCILRVTDDTHRTPREIEGELEWMSFVRKHGVMAPAVIPSNSGSDVELVDAGGSKFIAVLFEKLDGKRVSDEDWNPALFEAWGALVGRLHRIEPDFPRAQYRAHWNESDFLNIETYIPDDLVAIKDPAREVIAAVMSLPRKPGSYGMMHADVYQDNFFVSSYGLQLFDFDNCEYGFFANDIAIALYAALWKVPTPDRQSFSESFLRVFWKGYLSGHRLADSELRLLPLFLRLRDVLIYTVTQKMIDPSARSPRLAQLMAERSERIAARVPIVDVSGILA